MVFKPLATDCLVPYELPVQVNTFKGFISNRNQSFFVTLSDYPDKPEFFVNMGYLQTNAFAYP